MTHDPWSARWTAVGDAITEIGQELLERAPDDEMARADALRYVARLFRNAVGTHLEPRRADRPKLIYAGARIGGDNPDYRYGASVLDGALQYRLRIRPNEAYRFGLGTYSGGLGTKAGLVCDDYLNSEELVAEADGSYEVVIATEPMTDVRNHLRMTPGTRSMTVRETLLRPGTDRPADIEISCLTPSSARQPGQPETPADIDAALQRVVTTVRGIVRQFVRWTEDFAARPNEIHPLNPELLTTAQGDRDTLYHNGYYQLPDEHHGLVARFTPPPAKYWNIQACNHWLESLDPTIGTANLNHATAVAEPDGLVQVVFAAADPGMPNWIDTAGHLSGCIALRVVGAGPDVVALHPECHVVELGHQS